MRSTIITIFIVTFVLFTGGLVYFVDSLIFGEKLEANEAQTRAQMAPLSQAIETQLSALSDSLVAALPQIQESKSDFSRNSPLGKHQMLTVLSNSGGRDWNLDRSIYLEKSEVRNWAPNYLALLLKSIDVRDIKPGYFGIYSLLSPERRPFLFILYQMMVSSAGGEARSPMWIGILTGPEFLQNFMDRSKGMLSQVFVVNPMGQALGHTVPEYVGNQLKEDPIVAEIMKSQAVSGKGNFQDLHGQMVQGLYEEIPQSNVYAVMTTPLEKLLKNRNQIRLLLFACGAGLAMVGSALIFLFYKPEKELVPMAPGHSVANKKSVPPGPNPPGKGPVDEVQAERAYAFMQVSSALAHEMGGPMASILGHAQLLKGSGVNDGHLDAITEQARKVRETLRKLLTFAGEAVPKFQKTSLAKIVDKSLQKMEPLFFRKGVQVTRDYKPVPEFEMPGEMIVKAIDCVLENAVEAMERAPKKELKVTISEKQEWVEISISDSGEGIDPESMNKVFDPFYSTRKGHAGLGLSMAMGIFKEVSGTVFLDSKKGQGTVVRMMLNPTMTTAAGMAGQKNSMTTFANEKAEVVEQKPGAAAPQLDIKPPQQELIVLDSSEVEKVLEGHGLEEEPIETKSEPSVQTHGAPEEDLFASQPDATVVLSEPIAQPAEAPAPTEPEPVYEDESMGPYTGKIDKPHISLDRKESKIEKIGFQIRRPGAKA